MLKLFLLWRVASSGTKYMSFEPITADSARPAIRVSLVEDDTFFLNSFMAALADCADIQTVDAVSTLAEARQMLRRDPVDVLIVDLGLPDGSGIEVIRHAHQLWPRCSLLVSTTFADELHVIQSIEAGASGYLLKDSKPESIAEEIRSIHAGCSPISPLIARHVLNRFRHDDRTANTSAAEPVPDESRATLSARELEVLSLITKGFTYDEIGNLLHLSHNTIKTFVKRIYGKLEVKSKVEAIYEARMQGLLRG